ncbi:hypothetical protein BhaS171_00010 [Bacillus phage vB_BhaS-171]|uniref:Arc-like repressor n=1 Tax=Bacillus phage vB_BhaS-171 TaxID=1775140 RepID=UPI0007448877|nr:Arc-like repressor [Bacillus phage vB_BhaS-171]ALY08066.1 hypothetical protein BhaS171_00010 [Bacillus phage vB_BhaS-171]
MYKVINRFRDIDGHVYEVGDEFPKGSSKPTKKRIEELSADHPKYRRSFIEEVKESKKKDKE